jgi:hypothetical protein
MSTFNFGSLATTQAVSNAVARLKPWNIYPVKFAGARKETIKGKKDPNAVYEILKVRFEGKEGYYEESIFFPKDGDDVRPVYTNKEGHEYQGASSFDRTMTFIAQVASVLNPEGFKKMQVASSKFKSFDDVATAFIRITDSVKGKETNLKLTGRTQNGTIVPCLPKFVAINKQGERFTCDNFIGDNLYYSAYEESKRSEYINAQPTNMSTVKESPVNTSETSEEKEDDIDFDSLL